MQAIQITPAVRRAPTTPPPELGHRELLEGEFWRQLPAYEQIDAATFEDHRWQQKYTVTRPDKLLAVIGALVPPAFVVDLQRGLAAAPMALRLTPYVLSLIDWRDPHRDPLRRQFLPLASGLEPDHPRLSLDSLHERKDSPVPGLTHRYPDKALFLALDTCPVYCRFCTRSYAVGLDTPVVDKLNLHVDGMRWTRAFEYVAATPSIEDVVVSGGDTYNLRAEQISRIGHALLDIPHLRRIRFASKGPAILPMKLLSDHAWVDALLEVAERARQTDREVAVHVHFNHPREITDITRRAIGRLHREGVTIRNQSVLLRHVNDTPDTMRMLVKRLSFVNVHPYYVYQHDMVAGVEDLRTALAHTLELEKQVRGATAGFNTPTFVVDLPGGGGKRDAHSFETYDIESGISIYRSPNVDHERLYAYFDPISQLPAAGRRRWADPREHEPMLREVLSGVTRTD